MQPRSFVLLLLVFVATIFGVFYIIPGSPVLNAKPWRLGLDLVGGSHLVYEVDMKDVAEADRAIVMGGLRDVIERRVNLFGVAEPQVITAKSGETYRIIVELAGIKDVSEAIKEIGETPFLVFAEEKPKTLPLEAKTDKGETIEIQAESQTETEFVATELTGRYVESAQMTRNQTTSRIEISLIFNSEGATLFEEVTGRNIGKRLGVLLDGELITAPTVNEKISGGQAVITGNFTLSEARALVERFNAGALPAPIALVSQQTIGATLGTDSLNEILWAGIVGTLLIMLFMVIYYGRPGLLASLALLIYTVLVLMIFKLGFTMTLAGIAGIVLSIGMAVDANVLIFERTKEEIKRGVARTSALHEGFRRAWPSIRDSNIATIITSFVLFNLTSSFIKGFALSLLIGVLISMFTAITITRVLLQIFLKERVVSPSSPKVHQV